METRDIFHALKRWKNLLDEYTDDTSDKAMNKILSYLNQGTVFTVGYDDIERWKKSFSDDHGNYINAYVGINADDRLNFFLISSSDDKNSNFSDIQVKPFGRPGLINVSTDDATSPPTKIGIAAAISRNFYWNMFCAEWLKKLQGSPIFRLVEIPFEDYTDLGLKENESCFCFFGLTNNEGGGYNIEIITVKELTLPEICKDAENLSSPRPPFHTDTEDDFQLLVLSNAYL